MEHVPERVMPTPITDKEAQAKANIEATAEAHRLAAERRAQDENEAPLGTVIANSIKSKLEALPPLPEGQEEA